MDAIPPSLALPAPGTSSAGPAAAAPVAAEEAPTLSPPPAPAPSTAAAAAAEEPHVPTAAERHALQLLPAPAMLAALRALLEPHVRASVAAEAAPRVLASLLGRSAFEVLGMLGKAGGPERTALLAAARGTIGAHVPASTAEAFKDAVKRRLAEKQKAAAVEGTRKNFRLCARQLLLRPLMARKARRSRPTCRARPCRSAGRSSRGPGCRRPSAAP